MVESQQGVAEPKITTPLLLRVQIETMGNEALSPTFFPGSFAVFSQLEDSLILRLFQVMGLVYYRAHYSSPKVRAGRYDGAKESE